MPSRDSTAQPAPRPATADLPATVVEALGHAIEKLRYGLVQLTVHDGKVVQLDVTERHRFQ
jgi:hypothetical protein